MNRPIIRIKRAGRQFKVIGPCCQAQYYQTD